MNYKKSYKQLVAVFLSLCLVFGMSATVFGAGAESFTDIDQSHWAYKYVDDVVWREIFNGTSPTTFSPDQNMTRAMFVTALNNMYLANASRNNNLDTGFSDVPTGQYYTGAVKWAVDNGIVFGLSEDKFAPNEPITREQMAAIIIRYVEFDGLYLPGGSFAEFKDKDSIGTYAYSAVEKCRQAGLLSGDKEGNFNPQGLATRAEVAAVLSILREVRGGDSDYGDENGKNTDNNGGDQDGNDGDGGDGDGDGGSDGDGGDDDGGDDDGE